MAAILIISGVSIEHHIIKQQQHQAEQKADEATKARQSADKARRDAEADRDAKARENAEKQRQIDDLTKQLQAKRESEQTIASNGGSNSASRQVAGIVGNTLNTTQSVAYAAGCALYEPLVREIFGSAAGAAMIVMQKESSCDPNKVSPTNDHGLFQLNGMPIYEPRANVQAAYQKYINPRRGSSPNFSAWYAVCSPSLVPLYAGIWCS